MSNAQPGYYDDGAGPRRWWDGYQWTDHYEQPAVVTTLPPTVSSVQREANLRNAVAAWAAQGWTVNYVHGDQAVVKRQRRMGWFWNTVLVLVTGGLWLIYVIYRALNRLEDIVVLNVDAYGNVHRR
ncbi:DUF2510 domain-containing protein [Leifsonia sp. LS1]|uniref:DUF2510 domain-containing protein n=1 Tax=Leifsonia sp. LS1 TaxID=2828483 RepID=UPI001CFEFCC7|nr:DUF2510 domain-containing protein [Leifsonia sp. LS1]